MGSVRVEGRRRGALLFVCVGLALPNDVVCATTCRMGRLSGCSL
jgi:hypothetical protein